MLHVIENEKRSAKENMDLDAQLLSQINPNDPPILHLYDWKTPSLTYGHFLDPGQFLHLDRLKKAGIECAKRPTGGGLIFHTWDVAFAVIIPKHHPGYSINTLENYAFINRRVKAAIASLVQASNLSLLPSDPIDIRRSVSQFCMAKPTIYDVMMGGQKVAGAAQRRKPHAFLHQGSISLGVPDAPLLEEILRDQEVLEAMKINTFAPIEECWRSESFAQAQQKMRQCLTESMQDL